MKDKFTLLLQAIETELYDQALQLSVHLIDGERINDQYAFGYRAALLRLLGRARSIQRHHDPYAYLLPDLYHASVTEMERFVRAYEGFISHTKKTT